MLQYLPRILGRTLKGVRAGRERLVSADPRLKAARTLRLSCPVLTAEGRLPARFTADGDGRSPPLAWDALPEGAKEAVLIVEDPDAPTPQPLCHWIVLGLGSAGLAEGATNIRTGRNSYGGTGFLAPDPPPGHGAHAYVAQLFALDRTLDLPESPGRGAVVEAMAGHVLASGRLDLPYERP